jgi:serine protease inhibitor
MDNSVLDMNRNRVNWAIPRHYFLDQKFLWQGRIYSEEWEFFWYLKFKISEKSIQISLINKLIQIKISVLLFVLFQGKITNLFAKGTIDPSSVMVLVSAIYFKGQWQNKFQKRETVKAPFHMGVVSISLSGLLTRFYKMQY